MAGRLVFGWAISVGILAVSWGCGSSDGDAPSPAGGGAAPIPVEDLCPLFTSDLCVYLRECNGARFRDQEHCERELDCYGLPQLLQAVERGAVDYDPSKVGECHARFLQSPCTFGFFLFTPDIYDVLAYCPETITPLLDAGAECSADGECREDMQCLKDGSGACPGVCQPLAAEGESCEGNVRCADDLDCGVDFLCEPEQKAGDACVGGCSYSLACPENEVCQGNLWCDGSVCQLGLLEGEACGRMGSGLEAFTAECARHLWCDAPAGGAGVCRRPSPVGGLCNDQRDACADDLPCAGYDPLAQQPELGTCVGQSALGGVCDEDEHCPDGSLCIDQTCSAPAGDGEACGGNSDCAAGLVCIDAICGPPHYPGAVCDVDGSCTFGRCVGGTCDYHLRVGEPCASGEDCATGACVDGLCYDDTICSVPAP